MKASKIFFLLEWLLKILIFIFLLIALSSPIILDTINPNNRDGKDIVLAIDASGSMSALGFDYNNEISDTQRLSRFEITKLIAKDFIHNRVDDNVGIVIYGDFAFIASPISYEKEIVVQMLLYLNQGMAGQNTAIGEAILMSVRAFKHSIAKSKVVILLTDGEHNSGKISPKEAVKITKEKDIKIYTVAIGEKGEANEPLLKKIAEDTGAVFFSALNAKELQKVYTKIDELESSKIKSKAYLVKEYYYQYLLFLALFFLLFLIFKR